MSKRTLAGIAVLLLPLALSAPAAASSVDVDESKLVPPLSASFAPWICKMKITGPVCEGERHLSSDWQPAADIPCDVPLYGRRTENRYTTRFYDHDYLNDDRQVRTNDVDEFSTSLTGPAGSTIRTTVRFRALRSPRRRHDSRHHHGRCHLGHPRRARTPVWLVVGTLVEPHDGPATFTGHATKDGVTTTFADAPLEDVLRRGLVLRPDLHGDEGGVSEMRTLRTAAAAITAALLLPASDVAPAAQASPVERFTFVEHGATKTEFFPDDICGPRASTTTFTARTQQMQVLERPDGTWLYHEVAVVTYTSDYVDPALPDLTGTLTEVNHFTLTPGETFVGTVTFHDFAGDVKIFERHHVTMVGDEIVIQRDLLKFQGCP